MIPLTYLCDEYIDRPKLTEQKNPFEHIVPPPREGGRNKKQAMLANNLVDGLWIRLKKITCV